MDSSVVIQLSAFSGLAGALLTQALTGTFQYFGDKRKVHNELKSTYRSKQIDIAESFYYVTGEKMAIIKKNIDYWQSRSNLISEASLTFLNKEMLKLNAYIEKLDSENWKCNLVGLYFDITLTNDQLIAHNDKSKSLYLKVLEITDQMQHSLPESKFDLYKLYADAVNEMCAHYEILYNRMSHDMNIVKKGLAAEFGLK
ncbi:hypothetical protein IDJ77_11465 [Mucilaginibacter sp. ZT4R22]|uniref:Uncharacterized protein n=1 Tax=Mucilaginibacter pankratovii TaxID=2772110 RepID=A0ABR7WT24_9SPHI|nr:hypothetical protein [Mucilaginibacter pankratovii]MBD1364427.1 hypothetical protein [Mucilaginibacter pankratovii]